MANYLFTLTITPVQSFISQARKTKDLFSGSEILSDLIRNTLKEFDKHGNRIFPQYIDFVSNKFVGKLENKTQKEIEDLGEELENSINDEFMKFVFNETCKFDSAFKNFFTIFWVAVELGDDYKKSYSELEQNLGAIKNLRTFEQITQPAGEAKCSICGERNWTEKDNEDRLCLICYTKRKCSKDDEPFPLLADIVVLNKKDKIQNAQKFLEDNPSEKKYYALIQFDIDDMGKKLSSLDEDGQKELSKKLGDFAQEAQKIVNKSGQTIYAGGDDFLGFVNLAYLFEVLKEIKKSFNIYDLTYSTSIVIAHYKSPLHKVLDFSRGLLDETKSYFDDKNGVGLIVLSDSAINAKSFCKYEDFGLLKDMRDEKIGMSLHYKLHTIFNYLDKMTYDEFLTQKEMIKVEIKRLLKREEGDFNEELYNKLIEFFNKQNIQLSTNNYQIDFDNFIGYLKALEQLRKVL